MLSIALALAEDLQHRAPLAVEVQASSRNLHLDSLLRFLAAEVQASSRNPHLDSLLRFLAELDSNSIYVE